MTLVSEPSPAIVAFKSNQDLLENADRLLLDLNQNANDFGLMHSNTSMFHLYI